MRTLTLLLIILACSLLSNCGKSAFSNDSEFYVINIRSFDRAQLSSIIGRVGKAKPKLTVLDLRFRTLKDEVADSLLSQSLKNFSSPLIFTTSFAELYRDSANDGFKGENLLQTHNFFKADSYTQGHTMTISEYIQDKPVMTSFPLKVKYNDSISYHASFLSAYVLDSVKAKDFETKNKNQIPLKLSKDRINQYNRVDLSFNDYEEFDWDKLRDKIVVFGYTGPTNEDKKYTKLNQSNYKNLDTYGVFLVIEIICEITKIN